MASWRNWSGKLRSKPAALAFPRSEADAQALVRATAAAGQRLRLAGATHSHAPLVANDHGVIADLAGLAGVVSVDAEKERATVWGGSRLYTLGNQLHQHGLAFANQGDIDQQAIAGVTGTGTHGTGRQLKNFSAAVTGLRLITGEGEIVEASAEENADLWQASRLHLGAFGLVSQVELQLVPCYKLKERGWEASLDEILEQAPAEIEANRHFEFFWYPQADQANAKAINVTDDDPVYPLAEEGARCAWSHEVLPNHRPHPHTEMEYSVPLEAGIPCMRALRDLLKNEFPDVQWPVEFRTLAADDVWLSSAYERDTVTLSVHLQVGTDDEPYYRACEAIFLAHEGRPHWGKVNYLDGQALAAMHSRWEDWWAVRDRVDPDGTFLNPYLDSIRA